MGVSDKGIFKEFDDELDVRNAIQYAEDHFQEFLQARDNPDKVVYTSFANWLGMASPSLVNYRVIGGHNRGHILKKKPEKQGARYNMIVYGEDGRPISIIHVNEFGKHESYFSFDLDGYRWAMELHESDNPYYNGKHRYGDVFKWQYDSQGRIAYLAEISPGHSSMTEKYEYLEDGSCICHMYYYVPGRSSSSKDIPAGFKGSPMDEYRYEISPEEDIKELSKTKPLAVNEGSDSIHEGQWIYILCNINKETASAPVDSTFRLWSFRDYA